MSNNNNDINDIHKGNQLTLFAATIEAEILKKKQS